MGKKSKQIDPSEKKKVDASKARAKARDQKTSNWRDDEGDAGPQIIHSKPKATTVITHAQTPMSHTQMPMSHATEEPSKHLAADSTSSGINYSMVAATLAAVAATAAVTKVVVDYIKSTPGDTDTRQLETLEATAERKLREAQQVAQLVATAISVTARKKLGF